MNGEVDSHLFSEHQGIVGENFGFAKCASCGGVSDYGVIIVGDTPLGDLLNLGTVEVDTQAGVESVRDTSTLCEPCLEHLLEAKAMSEQ